MSFSPFAECRTFQFSYNNRDALYIDHRGDRVLADVEGSGTFSILDLPEGAKLWIDGEPGKTDPNTFSESLIVTSQASGTSSIAVCRGFYPLNLRPLLGVEKFEGCGWIVGSESISHVDGIADGWSDSPPWVPIPIMLEARGIGLRIAPVPAVFEKIGDLRMDEPEELANYGWEVKNASKLFDLTSALPDLGSLKGKVLSHLNQSSFSIQPPPGCQAILIRKLYDSFHGRQRARVLIDGQHRGWWYEPIQDRVSRWRWGQIGFSVQTTAGKLRIAIDPPAGAPLWSVSRYELFGLVSPA